VIKGNVTVPMPKVLISGSKFGPPSSEPRGIISSTIVTI